MSFVFNPSDTGTVKEFGVSLKQHLEPVSSTRQLLGAIHTPFEEEGNIRPIQCRRYITYLKDIRQKTQGAYSFLNDDTSIPLIFYALRHKLLPKLCFIKEHANTLIRHLEQYRLYPSYFSKMKLRHEICVSYQVLLSSLIEVDQQTQPLLDEALFHQRRLQMCYETTDWVCPGLIKSADLEYTSSRRETKKMPKEQRTFTPEFKQEAVHLVHSGEKNITSGSSGLRNR